MAEEDNTDDVADEMMRVMAEEAGETEATDEPATEDEAEEGGDDFAQQMLQAVQDEMGGDGDEAPPEDGGDLESQMIQAMATETGASTRQTAAAIQHLGGMPEGISSTNVRRILDVKLSVSIELGNTTEKISTLLHWTEGSLIELDKVSGELVDVIVNNKPYARGEVVVIAENFGVRLTEISPAPAPARSPV